MDPRAELLFQTARKNSPGSKGGGKRAKSAASFHGSFTLGSRSVAHFLQAAHLANGHSVAFTVADSESIYEEISAETFPRTFAGKPRLSIAIRRIPFSVTDSPPKQNVGNDPPGASQTLPPPPSVLRSAPRGRRPVPSRRAEAKPGCPSRPRPSLCAHVQESWHRPGVSVPK